MCPIPWPGGVDPSRSRASHAVSAPSSGQSAASPVFSVALPGRSPVPVLVLGRGITALGVLRSFGRAGTPVYAAEAGDGMMARSRWYRPAPWGSGAPPDPESLADRLSDGSHPLDRAVLLPCSDDWARAAGGLPEPLRERFPASVATPWVLDRFVDKLRFAHTLAEVGTPHPLTVGVSEAGSLDGLEDVISQGAFLKPRDSAAFFHHFGVKAVSVSGPGDARRRLEQVREAGFDVVLQEYLPGAATAHVFLDGFVDGRGRMTGILVRRRLRMFPVDFGNSTLTETVPPGEARQAVDDLRNLLSAVGYRGIFSAEFKQDPRDGTFKLLEVNPRAWWYVDFTARCGVDVCRMAYRDALGEPVPVVEEYRVGVRCVHVEHDVALFRRARREYGARLLPWFLPWWRAHQTIMAMDDPGPALRVLAERLQGRLARTARRAMTRQENR